MSIKNSGPSRYIARFKLLGLVNDHQRMFCFTKSCTNLNLMTVLR